MNPGDPKALVKRINEKTVIGLQKALTKERAENTAFRASVAAGVEAGDLEAVATALQSHQPTLTNPLPPPTRSAHSQPSPTLHLVLPNQTADTARGKRISHSTENPSLPSLDCNTEKAGEEPMDPSNKGPVRPTNVDLGLADHASDSQRPSQLRTDGIVAVTENGMGEQRKRRHPSPTRSLASSDIHTGEQETDRPPRQSRPRQDTPDRFQDTPDLHFSHDVHSTANKSAEDTVDNSSLAGALLPDFTEEAMEDTPSDDVDDGCEGEVTTGMDENATVDEYAHIIAHQPQVQLTRLPYNTPGFQTTTLQDCPVQIVGGKCKKQYLKRGRGRPRKPIRPGRPAKVKKDPQA